MEDDPLKEAVYRARDKVLQYHPRVNDIQLVFVSRGWMQVERRWHCYYTDKYSGVSALWKTANDLELIEMADQIAY